MSEIERTNLDAHVSLCELRYQNLERRLDQVESSIAALQTLVLEIRDSLAQQPQQRSEQWIQFQWGLIGGLGGLAGWGLSRLF
jgi:hypothetical protein